jgi:hypothetical protein
MADGRGNLPFEDETDTDDVCRTMQLDSLEMEVKEYAAGPCV